MNSPLDKIKSERKMHIIAIATTSMLLAILIPFYLYEREKRVKFESHYQRAASIYLTHNGSITISKDSVLNYTLKSFDSGKIWYAVDYGEHWEVNILGRADTLYPGLLERVKSHKALIDYVRENGSITPDDSGGMKLLNDSKLIVKSENK